MCHFLQLVSESENINRATLLIFSCIMSHCRHRILFVRLGEFQEGAIHSLKFFFGADFMRLQENSLDLGHELIKAFGVQIVFQVFSETLDYPCSSRFEIFIQNFEQTHTQYKKAMVSIYKFNYGCNKFIANNQSYLLLLLS